MCYAKSFLHTKCQHQCRCKMVSKCKGSKPGSRCESLYKEKVPLPDSANLVYCVKCFRQRLGEIALGFNKLEATFVAYARSCRKDAEEVFEERRKMCLRMEVEVLMLAQSCLANKKLAEDLDQLGL